MSDMTDRYINHYPGIKIDLRSGSVIRDDGGTWYILTRRPGKSSVWLAFGDAFEFETEDLIFPIQVMYDAEEG